jgi:tRNA (cmo5U34)-methyltransferase
MDTRQRQAILREMQRPERYDEMLEKCLPNAEAFFGIVAEYLPAGGVEILELGCGTGRLTRAIREASPDATITAIDRNPAMIALARQKSGLESVTFVEADIRAPWPNGPFDSIAATQVLFALSPPEQEEILRRSAAALRAGGRLIVGDGFLPENAWEEGIYRAHWREFMVESGMDGEWAEVMIASRDDVLDRLPTLAAFREMLEGAGFSRVFVPYWYELYAVVVASVSS